MAVNPVSGKVYVSNTEARNECASRARAIFAGHTVRGHLHESRITVIERAARHAAPPEQAHRLHAAAARPSRTRENASQPRDARSGWRSASDGSTLYVAAFGSSKVGVFDTAALEADTFVPSAATRSRSRGGGPTGLVLDERRTTASTSHALRQRDLVIDTRQQAPRSRTCRCTTPSRPSVRRRPPFLYDATLTSSNGEASCASCHVFGDIDSLAWDLGNPDERRPRPTRTRPFTRCRSRSWSAIDPSSTR